MNTCVATLRNGQVCGRKANYFSNGEWKCGIHKNSIIINSINALENNIPINNLTENNIPVNNVTTVNNNQNNTTNINNRRWDRNTLCRFGPNGLHLVDIDMQEDACNQTSDETEKLESLKGYINYRIGRPIFRDNESLPLVYMSKISHTENHIIKKNLAKELASTIEYLLSRPDVYELDISSVAEVILESFTYDYARGIFIANLKRID